jgi:hypothetical protein
LSLRHLEEKERIPSDKKNLFGRKTTDQNEKAIAKRVGGAKRRQPREEEAFGKRVASEDPPGDGTRRGKTRQNRRAVASKRK